MDLGPVDKDRIAERSLLPEWMTVLVERQGYRFERTGDTVRLIRPDGTVAMTATHGPNARD